MKSYVRVFADALFLFSGLIMATIDNNVMEAKSLPAHIVMCILEAKPEKEVELKKMLIDVAALSRKEAGCIEYHLHQDLNKSTVFILYEKWQSKEAHQKQFEKTYIIALGSQLADVLAKPYQAFVLDEL